MGEPLRSLLHLIKKKERKNNMRIIVKSYVVKFCMIKKWKEIMIYFHLQNLNSLPNFCKRCLKWSWLIETESKISNNLIYLAKIPFWFAIHIRYDLPLLQEIKIFLILLWYFFVFAGKWGEEINQRRQTSQHFGQQGATKQRWQWHKGKSYLRILELLEVLG